MTGGQNPCHLSRRQREQRKNPNKIRAEKPLEPGDQLRSAIPKDVLCEGIAPNAKLHARATVAWFVRSQGGSRPRGETPRGGVICRNGEMGHNASGTSAFRRIRISVGCGLSTVL